MIVFIIFIAAFQTHYNINMDQKLKFWAQKKVPLLYPNHVLATTGKSCSKKKVAFAQIIKGENVILGDFLG